jgi:Secretion system C-terminal sorting domain
MYDSVHAVIGGANGTILVTNNGGLSWVNENPPIHDSVSVNAFPNPTNGPLQFSYTLTKGEHVTLTIFDATGASVGMPLNYVFQAGPETVSFNTLNLASGSYFFRLQCEDYSTQGTFTVIH